MLLNHGNYERKVTVKPNKVTNHQSPDGLPEQIQKNQQDPSTPPQVLPGKEINLFMILIQRNRNTKVVRPLLWGISPYKMSSKTAHLKPSIIIPATLVAIPVRRGDPRRLA